MLIKNFIQFLICLRPKQWTKNLFIFAGILFSQNLFNLSPLMRVVSAFIAFCLVSGVVYLINDLVDLKNDQKHPIKSQRPLAAGKLNVTVAILLGSLVFGLAFIVAFVLGGQFLMVFIAYFLLQVLYTTLLKKIVILDVFSIAFGFVLRVIAGAVVINIEISSWLLICTVLLSLLIGLSKRRHELVLLEGEASSHRAVLKEYSPYLLDQMIVIVTSSTVIAYVLYTVSSETIAKFGTRNLILTVPFVLYGIFRYLYLIHQKGLGGSPENILVSDRPLMINIILWIAVVGVILYRF